MYRKVLIPLDASKEAEGVFAQIRDELTSDSEVILLQIVPRARTQMVGDHLVPATQVEEGQRSEAMSYCSTALGRLGGSPGRLRCEAIVSDSVSGGIVDFAGREEVDLIAMYTHDRKGLAALVKSSVAKNVQRKAGIEVRVFKPRELAEVI